MLPPLTEETRFGWVERVVYPHRQCAFGTVAVNVTGVMTGSMMEPASACTCGDGAALTCLHAVLLSLGSEGFCV